MGSHSIQRFLDGDKDFSIPTSLKALPGAPIKDPRNANQMVGSIIRLFKNAKVGDLIISPNLGYNGIVAFGRITSEFDRNDMVYLSNFGNYPTFFRQVNWTRLNVIRKDLPEHLLKIVQKPPAVSKVKLTDETLDFFDFAFGSYIYMDSSRLWVDAPRYKGRNFNDLQIPLNLISALISAHSRLADKPDQLLSAEDVLHILRCDSSDAAHLRRVVRAALEFNSPGTSTQKFVMLRSLSSQALLSLAHHKIGPMRQTT